MPNKESICECVCVYLCIFVATLRRTHKISIYLYINVYYSFCVDIELLLKKQQKNIRIDTSCILWAGTGLWVAKL